MYVVYICLGLYLHGTACPGGIEHYSTFFWRHSTKEEWSPVNPSCNGKMHVYRVTHQFVTNLPLTSKQKFCFCLAWPGQARPKRNFCFEVNGRFPTTWCVTLYILMYIFLLRDWNVTCQLITFVKSAWLHHIFYYNMSHVNLSSMCKMHANITCQFFFTKLMGTSLVNPSPMWK